MGCAVMRKSYLGLACTLIYVGFLGAIPVLLAAPLFAVVCYIGFLGYRLYLNSASGLTRRQFFFQLMLVLTSVFSAIVVLKNGLDFERGVGLAFRTVSTIPFFFVAYYCSRVLGSYSVLAVVVAAGSIHAFNGLLSVVFGFAPVIGGVIRPSGFLSPNITANSVMVAALCAFGLFLGSRIRSREWFFTGAIFFLLVFFLVYSATIKNVLTIGVVGFWLYLVFFKRQRVARGAFALGAIFTFALIVIFFTPTGARVLETFSGGTVSETTGKETPSSFEWRVMHWTLLIADWWQNYRIFGSGIGQAVNMEGIRAGFDEEGPIAHNDYVALLVEFGPVLGAIVVGCWAAMFRQALFSLKSLPVVRATCLGVLAALYIAMFGGNVMFTAAYLYLLWFVIGASYGEYDRSFQF